LGTALAVALLDYDTRMGLNDLRRLYMIGLFSQLEVRFMDEFGR
jgi:hypothetical protein